MCKHDNTDPHSLSNREAYTTSHLDFILVACFSKQTLSGSVELSVRCLVPQAALLILDTNHLDILSVSIAGNT